MFKRNDFRIIETKRYEVDIWAKDPKTKKDIYIECKGDVREKVKSPHGQRLKYVQIGLGQIISKMNSKEDVYRLAFPASFEPILKRHIPKRIIKLLKLNVFLVDEAKNIRLLFN